MKSEVEIFRKYLDGDGDYAPLGKPATEHEIADFERRYKIRLSSDLKEFFLEINGVNDGYDFVQIPSLDRFCLLSEYGYQEKWDESYINDEVIPLGTYFWFGNYNYAAWYWVIKLNTDPNAPTPVYVLYNHMTEIAPNFSDFIQRFRIDGADYFFGIDGV